MNRRDFLNQMLALILFPKRQAPRIEHFVQTMHPDGLAASDARDVTFELSAVGRSFPEDSYLFRRGSVTVDAKMAERLRKTPQLIAFGLRNVTPDFKFPEGPIRWRVEELP